MSTTHIILICWLTASFGVILAYSAAGHVREYGPLDALLGGIEIGVMIWLVTRL